MFEKIRKRQRAILTGLIVICMGIVVAGVFYYVNMLRENLRSNAVGNVMTVTRQQQQAFDNFIAGDRERLHSFADYFARNELESTQDVLQLLAMFQEIEATYSVVCLDEGWLCDSTSGEARQLDEADLAVFRALEGSGVQETYTDFVSGTPRFGYYETFTFKSGHQGVIQKSYDRSRVSETFSLSFYNDQGYAYVVNRHGDILLRSVGTIDNQLYENIFDILTGTHGKREDVEEFQQALSAQQVGSMTFTGNAGSFVYTYVPVVNQEGWYLVSIVPVAAISAETDQLMHNTQVALWGIGLVLVICSVFVLLIWRTHKDIEAREQEAGYQAQLFDVFTTYLANNLDDVYMILDHETENVEYISPNVERVLGIKPEGLLDYIRTADLDSDQETADAYYAAVQKLTPGEVMIPRSTERVNPVTGEHRYFLESACCADIQGQRKRVSYISDRTRERKVQDSLTQALQMAKAANDAKTAFLSSVSHDIRTPMNAIIGFLALMQDEADNPAMVREYAQRIDAASQHLLGLINDVLDMNKIESGSTTLSLSDMDMADVIDEINTIIRPQAKAKNQTFDIHVSQLANEHLLGDKMRINQILINLLSNAVKYTPEGGAIEMRVEELPQVVDNYSRIRFTVQDNGLGMSEDYLKVIFDPFTREETKITHEIQGTGLGMAITKSLVDLMGGTIHVESEQGGGSVFTVELELRIQEQEDDPKFWIHHSVARMIVVDDDEETCQNIVKAMARTGVDTDYATSGAAGIEMMRANREAGRPYDLILLDWMMPDLNGLETARRIRENDPDRIPILLLTAYDWSEIEQEAMEIGVDHFMPKPFFMSTFKEAIRRVMGGQRGKEDSQSNVVRGKRVLVVDDIEVNRIILVKILGTLGAVCDTAANGREAVDKFEASLPGEYDLILMDVQMPVMNGYEATRAIRAGEHPSAKTVPIIAMTANAFVDDVRDAIDSGMDAHIAKPVQMDKLKATIQQVLDSRKA